MDKTFGIRYEDGKPMVGDKLIDIVEENIVIYDEFTSEHLVCGV